MFLARVLRHSKLLFLLMVVFIAAQLFVAYNHGMVFSPFYNYWMYASKFTKSDSLSVFEIYAEGKPLRGGDYKQQDWDKIHLSYQYINHPEVNQQLYGEIRRLTRKAGKEMGSDPFIMPPILVGKDSLYIYWLQYASRVSGKTIDSVVENIYRWDGQKLVRR